MEATNNDLETTSINNTEERVNTEPPKLYAGKYHSVEELEKAYKNSAKVFNENKALHEKLKHYEPPESYTMPDLLDLPDSVIQEMQSLAKVAGLNQIQFNQTLHAMQTQQQHYQTQLETRKKNLGDKLMILEDYVSKTYPTTLHTTILNTLLGDEIAMSDALKHRDQCLNSQVPGLSSQRANLSDPHEGQQEMLKMAKEYEKNPTDKNRQRYINLAKEVAEARVNK